MKLNQRYRILRHLMDHGSITNAEAFYEYGIGHLASRISEMRADGIPIQGTTVNDRNRYGEPITYTRYSLEADELERWHLDILWERVCVKREPEKPATKRQRRMEGYIDFFFWRRICAST